MTGLLINWGLSQESASLPAIATMKEAEVEIDYVDRTDPSIPLVWATFLDGLTTAEIQQLRIDARGTQITPCGNPHAQLDERKRERIEAAADDVADAKKSERCVVFDTDEDHGLAEGDRVAVLFDVQRGMALLEMQALGIGFVLGAPIMAAISMLLLATSYHSIRAIRWRRREQNLTTEPA